MTHKRQRALAPIPSDEVAFKRIFDEYSEGVSYKQVYRDQNAFLVYYTKGFDGRGRPSIEEDSPSEAKQRAQFGARNEAWLGIEDARSELQYLSRNTLASDADGEVMKALERAKVAFDTYLSLAPKSQLEQARAG